MSFIIAIDVGVKNLGFSVYDVTTCMLVQWKNVPICGTGVYLASRNVDYVHRFIDEHAPFFANLHTLLIERQMRVNMRIIESVFQSRFFDRTKVLPAQSIKMHFGLSCQNYRANKKKAIEFVELQYDGLLAEHMRNMAEWKPLWQAAAKKDDMADSLLMIMYFLHSYSNETTNQDATLLGPPAEPAGTGIE
jgi:hypothetical protein